MALRAFEGVVEDGQIRLREPVELPEQTTVYVVIPDGASVRPARVLSPRLVRRGDAAEFAVEVTELPADAEV